MTADDLAKLDALMAGSPPPPPERIHNWQYTQLSVARHYGGITYQGQGYTIALNEPGTPLVRNDVLAREAQEAAAAQKEAAAKQKAYAQAYAKLQEGLF